MIPDKELEKSAQDNAERKHNEIIKADQELQKILLYVSAGAFGVSITFFTNSQEVVTYWSIIPLVLSWIMLGTSIILQALGYYYLKIDLTKSRNKVSEMIADRTRIISKEEFEEHRRKVTNSNSNSLLQNMDRYVIHTFIAGIVLLIFFATVNLFVIHERKTRKEMRPSHYSQFEYEREYRFSR